MTLLELPARAKPLVRLSAARVRLKPPSLRLFAAVCLGGTAAFSWCAWAVMSLFGWH